MSEFAATIKSSETPAGQSSMLDPTSSPSLSSSDISPPLPFEDTFQHVDISHVDYSNIEACPNIPFFMGGDRRMVLDEVEHLCQFSHNLVTVLGEEGVGKTALAYQAAQELSETAECCVMEASAFNSTENMLLILSQQLGVFIPEDADLNVMLAAINQCQPVDSHQNIVIIIDAAHHLHNSALQAFIQLLEKPAPNYFHVLLIGDSSLQIQLDKLDKHSVLVYDIPLRAFNEDEVSQYVAFKLAQVDYRGAELFSTDVAQKIWQDTKGIPAQINQAARKILLLDNGIDQEERNLGLPIGYMAIVVLLLAALILAVFYIDDAPTPKEQVADVVTGVQSDVSTSTLAPSKNLDVVKSSSKVPNEVDTVVEPVIQSEVILGEGLAESTAKQEAEAAGTFSIVDEPVDDSRAVIESVITPTVENNSSSSQSDVAAEIKTEELSSPPVTLPVAAVAEQAISDSAVSSPNTNSLTKGEAAVMSWPADYYTLQVMAAGKLESINRFVISQPNRDLLRIITLRRNGAPWHIVLGGVYETREEARLAITSLPNSQKKSQPWPRRIVEIQQKISDFRRK